MAKPIVSRPSARASVHAQIEAQRARLFHAHAVVEVTRLSIASRLEDVDETALIDALRVASQLIDDACGALERVGGGT